MSCAVVWTLTTSVETGFPSLSQWPASRGANSKGILSFIIFQHHDSSRHVTKSHHVNTNPIWELILEIVSLGWFLYPSKLIIFFHWQRFYRQSAWWSIYFCRPPAVLCSSILCSRYMNFSNCYWLHVSTGIAKMPLWFSGTRNITGWVHVQTSPLRG